jgi:hypothetical protein
LAAVSELTSTTGIVALVAAAVALVGLVVAVTLMVRLRRVRVAQRAVLGESGSRDLVEHARGLEWRVEQLSAKLDAIDADTAERLASAERRLQRALSRSSVVRYDAYNEMSGRQSSSIAILDENADGVVLSSILHREQARVYAKRVRGGRSELGISPEEQAAIEEAMARRAGSTPQEDAEAPLPAPGPLPGEGSPPARLRGHPHGG